MKILVVDDEQDIFLLFSQHFKEEIKCGKLEFYYVLSGEQALELLKTELNLQLVLILSDINMPGMNGLELLKKVKEENSSLIIFIITAYGDAKNSQLAWEYGAEEVITKPINFPYLKNLISDAMRIYKLKEKDHDRH